MLSYFFLFQKWIEQAFIKQMTKWYTKHVL